MSVNKVIFLDTETTGLNPFIDEIIQISAIVCDIDSQETETAINFHIESDLDIPVEVTSINGYYKGKWNAEGFSPIPKVDASKYIFDFITQNPYPIFCHNSSFDRAFVTKLLTQHGNLKMNQLPKYWFDTATLSSLFTIKSDWKKTSLDYCKDMLGVKYTRLKKHDSMDDCYLLKEVFFEFMKRIHVDA